VPPQVEPPAPHSEARPQPQPPEPRARMPQPGERPRAAVPRPEQGQPQEPAAPTEVPRLELAPERALQALSCSARVAAERAGSGWSSRPVQAAAAALGRERLLVAALGSRPSRRFVRSVSCSTVSLPSSCRWVWNRSERSISCGDAAWTRPGARPAADEAAESRSRWTSPAAGCALLRKRWATAPGN